MNEHAHATAAGAEVEVRAARGSEGIGQLFSFVVEGRVDPTVDVHGWPGAGASLVLQDGHGGRRTISGVIASGDALVRDDGTAQATFELVPAAYMLTLGRDCRYFLDKDVVELVTEVLGGVPHRWETTGSYRKRAYTVQYRESDWSFICRLLEEEGIFFWFDHAAGSQLVLGDHSPSADDIVGGATIRYAEDTGLVQSEESILGLGGTVAAGPTKFSRKSFDPANPKLDVSGGAGGGGLEVYDAPGGASPDPAENQRQAELAAAAAAAAASGVGGSTTSARLTPGKVLEVDGHPGGLDGRYLITSSTVVVVQRRRGEGASQDRPFQSTFQGIAASTPFRPRKTTRLARQAGTQSGTVMGEGEIHPDESGRVRVRMHWARTGGDGWWMRVAQRGTHDSLQIPRVGWNVLSFNDEGNVDAPSVLARIVDAEHPPPYPLPANKTRVVFKTPASPGGGPHNEMYFEDRLGEEQMFIHASKDMDIFVKHSKSEAIYRDSTRKVGRDHRLVVHEARRERIERDQKETVGGDDRIEIGQSNREAVEGDLSVTVAGNRKVEAGIGHSILVEKHRSLAVGSSLVDISLGDLSGQSATTSVTVGGALVDAAAKSVTQTSGGLGLSVVGGLRLRYAGRSHPTDVANLYVEAIGGALFQKTKGKYSDGATESASWLVGGKLEFAGKRVAIKAKDRVEIRCMTSVITILPEEITVASNALDLGESSDLVITTQTISHN